MSILDDLRNEMMSYAADFIDLDIVNFNIVPSKGPAWNIGDYGSFQVRIRNRGHMDVKNLKLHIVALNGLGKVRFIMPLLPKGWENSFVWPISLYINAHARKTIGWFQFKAEKKTNGAKDVIKVHIHGFDLTWDHLLTDHTGHTAAASDTHSIEIFPS